MVRLKSARLLAFILSLIFALTLCSCGKDLKSIPNVITEADLTLEPSALVEKYNFRLFDSFGKAVAAVNKGAVNDAQDADEESAVAGVFIGDDAPYVLLLKDATETDGITLACSMTINLGGNKLSFVGCKLGFDCKENRTDTIVIDARLGGSAIMINGTDEAAGVLRTRTNKVFVMGGSFIAKSDSEIAKVMGFYVDHGGALEMTDSDVDANSHYLYKSGAGYTASSIGIFNVGTATLNNCSVLGTHSGVQTYGVLNVDGGVYESFGHGGIYFCGANTASYIKNATVRECEMPQGYTQTVAGNHAGLYIGGSDANGVKVYMDNCTIVATSQPVVVRGTGGEKDNSIYISNSTIPLGTYYGLRVDNNTHRVYIGKGNNFGIEEVKIRTSSGVTEADLDLMVTVTDEVYCID